MAILVSPPKDPGASETFGISWARRLALIAEDETIAGSAWSVPTGLTLVSSSYDDTQALVKLSGGDKGVTYRVTNTITTSSGEVLPESLLVPVAVR